MPGAAGGGEPPLGEKEKGGKGKKDKKTLPTPPGKAAGRQLGQQEEKTAGKKREPAARQPEKTACPPAEAGKGKRPATAPPKEPVEISCTVEIRCDALLDRQDRLSAEKWGYVPKDGVILAKKKVSVPKGTDAFRLLSMACQAGGIALDAEYTPMYGSYYVRGIGHLYEMDAGDGSGWLYEANGKRPDIGASGFLLSDGDAVLWRYVCDEMD